MGHDQAGPGRPRLTRTAVYSSHGPKPDPACEIPISPTVVQARFARFRLTGRLPGLACDVLRSYSRLYPSCASSSSIFRGHNLLDSLRPAVSLDSRPLPTSGVRSRVCHAPIVMRLRLGRRLVNLLALTQRTKTFINGDDGTT